MDRNVLKIIKCCLVVVVIIAFVVYSMIQRKNSKKTTDDEKKIDVSSYDVLEKIEINDEKYIFLKDIEDLKYYKSLSDNEIEELSKKSIEKLNVDIPEEYKEFLKISNGVTSSNGSKFYSKYDYKKRGRYDIVDVNYEYRELTDIEDFIKLGNDDLSYFVYDIKTSKYQVLTNGTLDVCNEYDHFYELLKAVLTGEIYKKA